MHVLDFLDDCDDVVAPARGASDLEVNAHGRRLIGFCRNRDMVLCTGRVWVTALLYQRSRHGLIIIHYTLSCDCQWLCLGLCLVQVGTVIRTDAKKVLVMFDCTLLWKAQGVIWEGF